MIYEIKSHIYIYMPDIDPTDGISQGMKNLISIFQFWDRQQWNYEKPIIENIILSGA